MPGDDVLLVQLWYSFTRLWMNSLWWMVRADGSAEVRTRLEIPLNRTGAP